TFFFMKPRIMTFLVFTAVFLLIDYYLFQAVLTVSKGWSPAWKNALRYGFWLPTALSILALVWWTFGDPYRYSSGMRNWVITALVTAYISKVFGIVVVFIDDLQRGVKWLANFFYKGGSEALPGNAIPRSEFLAKTALVAASIPFG